jgi:hypothetical protein
MAKYLNKTGLAYFWEKVKNLVQSSVNERAKACLRGYAGNQTVDKAYTNKRLTLSDIKSVDNSLLSIQGSKIVVEKKGDYLISVSSIWSTKATNKLLFTGVAANGDNWLGALNAAVGMFPSGSYTPHQTNTQIYALDKGDYIEPVIQSNIAGATCDEFRISIIYVGEGK